MKHILSTNHFISQLSKSKFLLIIICLGFQVSHLALGFSNKSKVILPTTTTVNSLPAICSSEATFITLSATVSPDPEDGTIQFLVDGSNVGLAAAVVNGAASINYDGSALTSGNHIVKAVFSGNATYLTSTSADVIINVNNVTPGMIAKGASSQGPACSSLNPNVTLTQNGTTSIAATGSGTISYLWQQSTDGGVTWTDGEANSTTPANTSVQFNPKSMTMTTRIRRMATSTLNSVACSAYSNELEYIVYPVPVVSQMVALGSLVCEGGTLQVTNTTTGGVWSSSSPANITIDASGLLTGISAVSPATSTISYKVTDNHGCSKTVTKGFTVRALPVVTTKPFVCNGESFNLSPATGGTWTSSNPSVATVTNAGLAKAVAPGTVSFTFTNNTSPRCTNTTDATIVSESPSAMLTSGNAEICAGQSVILTENIVATGNWTVTLNDGSTATGTDNGSFEITVNPVSNQNYKITSLSSSSCNAKSSDLTGTTSVIIKPTPAAPVISVVDHCSETSTLTASNYTGSLLWSTNESTESITVSTAGNYSVTQNINGCISNSGSALANPKTAPVIPIVISPIIIYCKNSTAVQLTATGDNLLWYETQTEGNGNNLAPVPQTSIVGFTNYYVSQTVESCESERAIITVNVKDDCNPMPVTLVVFSVKNSEKGVLLVWKTTNEINSSRFEVEKSLNPVKGFTKIASVPSRNNEFGENYTFSDFDIFSDDLTYYRLKMIDQDESFAYSRIVSLNFEMDESITLFPNPTADYLQVETYDWSNVKSIKLIDLNGRTVYNSSVNLSKTVDLKSLTSGMYIVEITRLNGLISTKKIAINK